MQPRTSPDHLVLWARRGTTLAAVYGFVSVVPLYFLESRIGSDQPPAITHPEFFYGFAGVALAWQIAFLIMSRDPVRYRPMYFAAVFEKLSWGVACWSLYLLERAAVTLTVVGTIDLVIGWFFFLMWRRLPRTL